MIRRGRFGPCRSLIGLVLIVLGCFDIVGLTFQVATLGKTKCSVPTKTYKDACAAQEKRDYSKEPSLRSWLLA